MSDVTPPDRALVELVDRYSAAIVTGDVMPFFRDIVDEIYVARLDAIRVQDAVANVTIPLNELARELGRVTWELGKLSWMNQPTTNESSSTTQETETSE